MAYATQAEIEALIPPQFLREALDDDGDGQADDGLLAQVIANAGQAVDALICGRYELPFAVAPKNVLRAGLVFACESIYQRRQVPAEQNPWTKEAETWRKALREVGEGKGDLDAATSELAAAAGGQPFVPGRIPAAGANTTY